MSRKYLTEKEFKTFQKKIKQKKMGFKGIALDVEEVLVKETLSIPRYGLVGRDKGFVDQYISIKPGTYYHVYMEYLV
jgi:hypothetical protein